MVRIALSFCLALGTGSMVMASAETADSSYVLGPGDRVVIRCPGAVEFTADPIRIDDDGHVTLPFVGRVGVGGHTVSDSEKLLNADLSRFLRHPEVQVSVVEARSQPVSVLGAVKNPGFYQLEGGKTLAEVLALSGGLRPDAGEILTLRRAATSDSTPNPALQSSGGTLLEFNVNDVIKGRDQRSLVEVRPHDVITVSQAPVIYVVGQVRRPGGFPLIGKTDCTVLQALSLAEGLEHTAAGKRAVVLRKQSPSGRVQIPLNLDRILAGRAPDPPLYPDDVLFVPNNSAKSAGMKTLDTILQTTTGMAIYGRF